jgi:rare lipoprotein A
MFDHRFAALAIIGTALAGCQAVVVQSPPPISPAPPPFVQVGLASWYGPGFAGKRMADGQHFNMTALTAAHRTLPLHSTVRVTNLDNGKSVIVQITDRGPYYPGRILDLSAQAANDLRMKEDGLARVRVEVLDVQAARF